VHTTQFAIRDPKIGLFEPVLKKIAHGERCAKTRCQDPGVLRKLAQATSEAEIAAGFGYVPHC